MGFRIRIASENKEGSKATETKTSWNLVRTLLEDVDEGGPGYKASSIAGLRKQANFLKPRPVMVMMWLTNQQISKY